MKKEGKERNMHADMSGDKSRQEMALSNISSMDY